MKENNKTKLMIGQIIYVSLAIIFLTIFITIKDLNNQEMEVADQTIKSEIVNETDKIEVAEQSKESSRSTIREKSATITSRFSSSMREAVSEEKYVSLDEVSISRNMDLTERTGLSKEDFKTLVANIKQDTTKFFYNNSDTIYDLCKKYELNEIFFCGLIAGESGWNIASNHRNTHNYISLMSNGKLLRFATVEEGLEKAASTLHNKYLSPNGRFYAGKTLDGVKKRFCPASSTWTNLIYKCMSQMVK